MFLLTIEANDFGTAEGFNSVETGFMKRPATTFEIYPTLDVTESVMAQIAYSVHTEKRDYDHYLMTLRLKDDPDKLRSTVIPLDARYDEVIKYLLRNYNILRHRLLNPYIDLLWDILDNGENKEDRTNTGTISKFGHQMRFDLSSFNFPLIGEKYTPLRLIFEELKWFLSGDTNIKYLVDNDVHIWDEWATETGELGPIYGKQWRDFNGVDQITDVIEKIKSEPDSRRLIVSTWNPEVLPDETITPQENVKQGKQALAPCHTLFQFYVQDGKLSCQLYQR